MKLYFNGVIFNLTPHYDELSLSVTETNDKTFDRGSFVIPYVNEELFITNKEYVASDIDAYNSALNKFNAPVEDTIDDVDLTDLEVGTIIRISNPIYNWIIVSGTGFLKECSVCPPNITTEGTVGMMCGCSGIRYRLDTITYTYEYYDVVTGSTVVLDMSRPLPRYSRVQFEIQDVEMNFLIQNDTVTRVQGTDLYKHEVEIVSPTKLLMESTNPSMTLTQPQGNVGTFIRSLAVGDDDIVPSGSGLTVDFTTEVQSTDTAVLEDQTVKGTRKYKVYVDAIVENRSSFVSGHPRVSIPFSIQIKVGGVVKAGSVKYALAPEYSDYMLGIPRQTFISLNTEFDNTGSNDVEVVLIKNPMDNVLAYVSGNLNIYTADTTTLSKRTLDYFVDKILRDDLNTQLFYLDEESTAKLSTYISPQWTLPSADKWTQINEVADYIKAFVRCYFEDDSITSRLMVNFKFFEDLDVEETPPEIDLEQSIATIDDYTESVELNASNTVYGLGEVEEWLVLKASSDEVAQITTDNIGVQLANPIEEITYFGVILGKIVTNGTSSRASSYEWDLTNQIVEKQYYNTLEDLAEYTLVSRTDNDRKVDFVNYTRGDDKILGLNYTGTQPAKIIGSEVSNRAIYEMVFSAYTRETGINVTTVDSGLTDDDNILIHVKYKPLTKTNAVLFKDDKSGFQANPRRYLNEQQSINDSISIGDYAQGMVNRMGNTQHAKGGIAPLNQVPKVSTKYGDLLLSVRTWKNLGDKVSYSLTYVKDYVFVSSYEGYDSRTRLYQMGDENIVQRDDKLLYEIQLSTEDQEQSTDFEVVNYIQHVKKTRTPGTPPIVADLQFTDSQSNTYDVSTFVNTKVVGSVIEWRLKMYNHFSAGKKRETADSKKFQLDVAYTDMFGRAEHVDIDYISNITYGIASIMPNAIFGTSIFNVEYDIRKDAREIPNLSVQWSYTSLNDEIIIYSGLAKKTDMVKHTLTYEPIVAELDYLPDRNSRIIDLTRATPLVTEMTVNVTDASRGYLRIAHANAKPIAIYDSNTLELLIVDTRELYVHEIYYGGNKL